MIIKISNLRPGSGKTNPTLLSLTAAPITTKDSKGKCRRLREIVYVTTREEVERQDTSRFLSNFGPALSRKKLRRLRGKILFTVDGYDDNPDEVYLIPEVRAFYARLHAEWPCWLFAACLASPSLNVIALSVIPNLTLIHTGNKDRIVMPEDDICNFFMQSLPAAAFLNFRAGASLRYGAQCLRAAARHLGVVRT